jgi:hypothetical protein
MTCYLSQMSIHALQTETRMVHKTKHDHLQAVWIILKKCSACIPRQPVQTSYIDEETGHIHLKKRAQWLNAFTYIVTYLFHCNTDITSLKSGTAIRGVLLYI